MSKPAKESSPRYSLKESVEKDWDKKDKLFWYILDSGTRRRKNKYAVPIARFRREREARISLEALNRV